MRRITELDALRGLASLSIVTYHLKPTVYDIGWPRVDFFLVLSGFLITTMILKYRETPGFLSIFWTRRALRIWPLYYLALFVLVAVNPVLAKPFPMAGLPYYLTFTQNVPYYWSATVPPFNWYFEHTWSLGIEEQFVLLWPVLIGMIGRRHLVPVMLGMVVMSWTARAEGYHTWLLLARCDGFALGGLLAAWSADPGWMHRHRTGLQRGLTGLGFGSLAYLVARSIVYHKPGLSTPLIFGQTVRISAACLLYFAVVGLVVSHTGHPLLAILRKEVLRYLGRISYGMYIFHAPLFITIVMLARSLGYAQTWAVEVVMVGTTILVASACREWIELPIMRFRERFRFQKTDVGASLSPALRHAASPPVIAPIGT